MKKLVVSLAMFVAVLGTAFASDGDNKINNRVEAAFKNDFVGARSVQWETITRASLYQAHFIYNNERVNAFYDAEGNLVATGRFVSIANLPLVVRKNISEKYKGYDVKEVIEYTQGDETSYLVSLENEKNKILVQGFISGSAYTFKKEKKNSIAKL